MYSFINRFLYVIECIEENNLDGIKNSFAEVKFTANEMIGIGSAAEGYVNAEIADYLNLKMKEYNLDIYIIGNYIYYPK